jgi:hypothetical protein
VNKAFEKRTIFEVEMRDILFQEEKWVVTNISEERRGILESICK